MVIDFSEKTKLSEEDIKPIITLKQKCEDFNIPLDFKSWGRKSNNPNANDPTLNPEHRYYDKAGCMLDGKIYHYDPVAKATAPTISLFGNGYYVMDDFRGYQSIWELKSYLPLMQDELYQSLKEDIRINGLNDPILYYVTNDGVKLVIEGHTRLKACIELNLQNFPTKEIKEDFYSLEDIQLWMLKHQFQRRNLSTIEKLELAYKSKEIIEKQAKGNQEKAGKGDEIDKSIDTNQEIANLAGVGRSIVVNYGAVLKKDPSLIDKMKSGELSISAAYNKVKEKPSNPKTATVNPEIKYLNSFDEAKELLKNGTIEGILMLDNENKANILTNVQKYKLGVLLIKN